MPSKKILIVDDDPISRMLLAKVLDANAFNYKLTGSAMEAFEAVSDRSYFLILMDIEMPDTNGLEAAKFIRSLSAEYFQNIPIIALTSHKKEDVTRIAAQSGMSQVLSKPIQVEELLAAIERYLPLCEAKI